MTKKIFFAFLFSILFLQNEITAQGNDQPDNPYYKIYFDSLKAMDYNRTFPILGKQAYKKGYDVQFPWGFSAVYFTQTQEINITRTSIGFNGGKKVDISKYIDFGPTVATTNAYTVRPDLWVLPFLNIYGIVGAGTTKTEVNLLQPVGISTTQHFNAKSFGFGATIAGAVGPIFIAWDNNYNFADIEAIVEPIPAFNSSLRVGHNFRSYTKPERMFSVWGGVFYQSLQSNTEGSITINSIFPDVGNGATIEYMRTWAADLPLAQRVVANQIIDAIEQKLEGADIGNKTIDYTLDKEVAGPFNLIFGAQYQFNKNWILRTELGVFGKRSQFLLNLNYRFQGL